MDNNVPEDYTILRAAKGSEHQIPTLCFLKDVLRDRLLPDVWWK